MAGLLKAADYMPAELKFGPTYMKPELKFGPTYERRS